MYLFTKEATTCQAENAAFHDSKYILRIITLTNAFLSVVDKNDDR